jgi:radical SAM superfamily enzyme YgiQ (UPF0313 family)
MGNYCRMRSPENVVEELKYWYTRGYREIDFRDDIPNFSRERLYGICRLIEKSGLRGLDLKCGNGLRADLTDRELLKAMFDAGFREVAFGAESGSERILRRIKKGEGLPAIKRAIRDACEIGYDVSVSFMVGYPDETPSDFEESIKLALEYPVAAARFYNTIPFPGTELYDWVKENNYFIKRAQDYLNDIAHFENEPVFATPQFSCAERKKALFKARKTTACVGRRAMERKLRRYELLAGPLSLLVYSPLGRRIIFAAMANKAFKRMLMPVLKILRLNFYMV